MEGESNLEALIRSMRPRLRDGTFVFVAFGRDDVLPDHIRPVMSFAEEEGTTWIVEACEGVKGAFPCRMITLDVHSALDAVGFLATVTTALAKEGISVNAVSAFFHDHLFVPLERADDALRILEETAAGAT